MTPSQDAERVYLIDASIYVFRAWFSMPGDFSDPAGRPTNAVYGFARFLCEFIERTGARRVAVAFDESLTQSFRNDIYPDYKANRESAPEDLRRQFGWCRDLSAQLGLPCHWHSRYEADDLIATLADHWRRRGHPVTVVTGDKDLAQLVLAPDDRWWDYPRRAPLCPDGVHRQFGVRPEQIADYLALTGDPVDNIPGVAGVGPKTAAGLLAHFGDIDTLYERLDELAFLKMRGAKAMIPRLRQAEPVVRLARRLTTLEARPDAVDDPDRAVRGTHRGDELDALLDSLGFGTTLRARLQALNPAGGS
ncbi:MAG: 5'-3' exonuclease H3TH domain-containing protein [Wenzhouxiangellaceae bacterium]